MNRSQGNLQDAFLNSARRESIGVTIYLVSGVQLRGVIRAFDAFTVLLESQGRPAQMVYKHAIASVAPVRPVPMDTGAREERPEATSEPASEPSSESGTESGTAGAQGAPSAAEPVPTAQVAEVEPDGIDTPEPAERELPVSP